MKPPAALAVDRKLGAPAAGVADLKFRDFFTLPIGPKGLEPTQRLRSLDGQRVRLVGYMVQQHDAAPGGFLLSPLPVAAGDEDESLADDIPASAVFVSLPNAGSRNVPALGGLIQITGTLHVGAYAAPGSDRVAAARIDLAGAQERALLRLADNAKPKNKTRGAR